MVAFEDEIACARLCAGLWEYGMKVECRLQSIRLHAQKPTNALQRGVLQSTEEEVKVMEDHAPSHAVVPTQLGAIMI